MLSADAAFEASANAAARAFAAEPPFLQYRVRVDIRRAAGSSTSESLVVIRTADGSAAVRTGGGASRTGAPPALPLTVDALAEWGFRLDDTGPDARLSVAYERPRSYAALTPAPGVDVAVTSVRGYRAAYVPGEADRVRLEPVTPEMRAYASGKDDFVYRDLTFDPATMLPVRVVLAAPGETLTLDYTTIGGAWVLARAVDDDRTAARSKSALRVLDAHYDEVTAVPGFPPGDPPAGGGASPAPGDPPAGGGASPAPGDPPASTTR